VLLATLLPAYLVIQGAAVREDLARGNSWYGFGWTGAQGASGHPLVVWEAGTTPLRVGDRLLRFADIDLRGLSRDGDGMMVVFGAPEELARKEQQAALAARRIVDSMPATLAVGVGIATGEAFVGGIRSPDRLIWSAVGSTTNLASRLQSMTRELSASIALDETTRERAGYVCTDFVRHADLAIRGRTGRFDVFTLPLREGPGATRSAVTP
jgi:class 3 adenylate cyclase